MFKGRIIKELLFTKYLLLYDNLHQNRQIKHLSYNDENIQDYEKGILLFLIR